VEPKWLQESKWLWGADTPNYHPFYNGLQYFLQSIFINLIYFTGFIKTFCKNEEMKKIKNPISQKEGYRIQGNVNHVLSN
jgi:hypothetical protein